MNEEKRYAKSGFRIKWADREIEYYGDSVLDVFNNVFEHVKNIPVGVFQPTQAPVSTPAVEVATQQPSTSIPLQDIELDRISKDAKVSKEQILKVIKFQKSEGFSELVPYLPMHPSSRDAAILVTYALQVGLQKAPIEFSYLKKVLKGPNGYPLPSNELGLSLIHI